MKRALVVFALLAAPHWSFAQGISVEAFEKILKQDLGKDFEKKGDPSKLVEYDIKDTPYWAYFNAEGKFVNFMLKGNGKGVSLDKINAWNVNAVYSRAYLQGPMVIMEVTISTAETSPAVIRRYYNYLEEDTKKFLDHIGAK